MINNKKKKHNKLSKHKQFIVKNFSKHNKKNTIINYLNINSLKTKKTKTLVNITKKYHNKLSNRSCH